jgi:putative DNA primase/helicase
MGKIAPDRMPDPMLNCRNGMVDLASGALKPWGPEYPSTVQIPIEFDPKAKCPTYAAWLQS